MKPFLPALGALIAVAALAVSPAPAAIYRWRDARGGLHFGDLPPDDGTAFESIEPVAPPADPAQAPPADPAPDGAAGGAAGKVQRPATPVPPPGAAEPGAVIPGTLPPALSRPVDRL